MNTALARRLARLERAAPPARPAWAPQVPVEAWTEGDLAAVRAGVQRAAQAGRTRPLAWMPTADLLTLQGRLGSPLAASAGLEVSP